MIKGAEWTERELKTLRERVEQGVKIYLIARELGRTNSAAHAMARKLDLRDHSEIEDRWQTDARDASDNLLRALRRAERAAA